MVAKRWMSFLVVAVLFALPSGVGAQEAFLSGVVTDSTGGVLPGVAVTAVHVASGNTFNSTTDERGEYRLPARAGDYRVTAALDGFAAVTQEVELLVGQVARTTFELVPSALQETVTVTGQAALLDTTQSTLSTNIDRRQMESLPVNGRNWMGLALLAPGSKAVRINETPAGSDGFNDAGTFQIILDGQEITQMMANSVGTGQARVSREAIQEFEFIANRFDAEHGRSGGVIVSAVTKSGTNAFAGTLAGYFRHDKFNAKDFVAERVLPYSNQQIAGTFGGPIIRDRAHFFAFYEYEREPRTTVWNPPYPSLRLEFNAPQTVKTGGGRFDLQFSSATRLMVRGNVSRQVHPVSQGFPFTNDMPTYGGQGDKRDAQQVYGSLTHVLDDRTVNEISGGWNYFRQRYGPAFAEVDGAPSIWLGPRRFGKIHSSPRHSWQDSFTIRNNFTAYRSGAGTHDLRVGGDFIAMKVTRDPASNFRDGRIFGTRAPGPELDIASVFPVLEDWTTWNLAALSPYTTRYDVAIGNFANQLSRKSGAFWFQDNWKPTDALTLNLGVRSDFCYGCYVDDREFPPLTLLSTRKIQKWTFSPRLGFVYALPNNRTVIRGGGGRFYFAQTEHVGGTSADNDQTWSVEIPNDGRPNFAADPWNVSGGGKVPTFEELKASGRLRTYNFQVVGPDARVPYSWQSSVGFQHELATGLAVQADFVRGDGRALPTVTNRNLTCNPATGFNFPFSNVSTRPYPEYAVLPYVYYEGKSESNSLQTAVTKRFSQGWQLSGTYTLSKAYDNTTLSGSGFWADNPCGNWQEDEWAESVGEQRHRLVLNGVWSLPAGFEVSGLYFYGSGERYSTFWFGDPRNQGNNQSTGRLRPDGTVVPRNDFVGEPLHRVDLRLQKRFALGGGVTVDGILEVFNAFNHANYRYADYGLFGYVGPESIQPVQSTDAAYLPRMLQLGFRVAF